MSNDLPERLRFSAEEFEPDTERMWSRVASGMAEPAPVASESARRRSRLPHLALATCVVVALIGAIVFLGYGAGPVKEGVPSGQGSSPSPVVPEGTAEAVTPSAKPDPVDEVDYLTAGARINGHVNDYWSQSEVTIRTEEPVTELTAELHVVLGTDVEFTGSWTTADDYFHPAEVFEREGYLVFRWRLKEGQVIEPGEYILAGQYNHGEGPREPDGDYFTVETEAASGGSTVIGGVEPKL
jgi:hypothetical protein